MVGDNIFDVTKGKSKDYYALLIREKAKPPNIIQKLQSNFHFNSDHLKQIFKLPHSIVVESYVDLPVQSSELNSLHKYNVNCIKQVLEQMIYVLSVTIKPNQLPICSSTAHVPNIFRLSLNYIGALFRINGFVSA